jgi:hypothetical protein
MWPETVTFVTRRPKEMDGLGAAGFPRPILPRLSERDAGPARRCSNPTGKTQKKAGGITTGNT